MIIQGPKEPKSMQVYLRIIADEFRDFAPDKEGFLVRDSSTNEEIRHRVFLAGLLGDTPARTKFAGLVAHSGKLGCPYCVMNSQKAVGYRISYWKGYSDKVPVDLQ